MTQAKTMKYATRGALAGLALLALSACSSAPSANAPVAAVTGSEQVFASPDEAVDALVSATRADNQPKLLKVLGPKAANLVYSGDPVADKESRERFITAYDAAHKIEAKNDDTDILVVGDEEWPLPIPIVQSNDGWHFDTAAGQNEILNRRIGRNELNVIGVCRTYVEAQREFAIQHKMDGDKMEYAQRFTSTEGTHDGLYWPAKDGEEESPLGPLIADARAEGYGTDAMKGEHHMHAPYHGYYYKILTRQGSNAPSGAKDYIVDGHMTQGFALLAFPAVYGDSGVMSFIVNQNGIVYEKDLGPDTKTIARKIKSFDPDQSWHIP